MMEYKGKTDGADNYCWQVRVLSSAHLDHWITDNFNGLKVEHLNDGTTVISGVLTDLPAVYGLVLQMRDTGVNLLSLHVDRINI